MIDLERILNRLAVGQWVRLYPENGKSCRRITVFRTSKGFKMIPEKRDRTQGTVTECKNVLRVIHFLERQEIKVKKIATL